MRAVTPIIEPDREREQDDTEDHWRKPCSGTEAVLGLQAACPVAHRHRAEGTKQHIR